MCGIAGIVGSSDRAVGERAVRKMIRMLKHRGPDSEGIESWDGVVLGHRRLAIFDLSDAGRQPMVSSDRSVGLVFNGAIYNYRALRKELLASGYVFQSNTDTEVVIQGYLAWGLDRLISRLRGMFAFALWDDSRRKLYLVRDRLGVKPLVFTLCKQFIAFASTVRALRAGGYANDLDENGIIDYLNYGYVTDDRSIYRGICKVPPASVVEWSSGSLKIRPYWSPANPVVSAISFEDAVDQTELLLLDSVKARLHADVPVAALLSGGIDSSLVCWAVAELGGDVTAYTIGTPGHNWDESTTATSTAQRLGIQHCVLQMSDWDKPEIAMEELLSAYSEPFACASALGMLRVSRAVSSSAKVLLTGDGGDDVFLGYPRHRYLWLAGKLSQALPTYIKTKWPVYRSRFPRIGSLRRVAALLDYTTGGLSAFLNNSDGWSIYKANELLGDRFSDLTVGYPEIISSGDAGQRALADFLDYERDTRFVGEYMTKVDGATMHYGLEARSPFLDQFLWEFASSLPFDVRLHRGALKAILRELARRKIGKDLAKQKKRGFGVPVQQWITGRWRTQVETVLRESILDEEGWINSGAALGQLELAANRGWAPEQLWYIFVLESWLRCERFNDNVTDDRPMSYPVRTSEAH
jgi:asparagine synthase (glutamine-hydrolysing)